MDEKGLGKRLQQARQQAGMTQQVLCQRAGLSYSTLTKIERGAIRSPSIFTIQSIANALNVSLDELIGVRAGQPTKPKERRRSKSGVRFVYFDVNGCLVGFFHRALTQLAHDSGQPADMVEAAFWHYNDQVCRGEMSVADFNVALAGRLQLPSVDWFEYYLNGVDPVPEMHELVNWASEHYGVGLLSNIMPGLIAKMQERGLLPAVPYDAIVDSSEVHAIKPEPKIYEVATERAGQQPDEILLIDDSRANLMAAEKFGWHVLWFDPYRPSESTEQIQKALEPAEVTAEQPAASPQLGVVSDPEPVEQPISPSAW